MSAVLDLSERDTVTTEAMSWPDRARAVVVTTAEQYVVGADLLKGIKALRTKIAETFDPHVRRAHEAHKALVAEKAAAEAPLTQAEQILKHALVTYDNAQAALQREAQRIADEQARRDEEQRRLETAAAMEIEGHDYGDAALVAEAHALLEEPVLAMAAPVAKSTPTVAGLSYRTTYAAQVTDLLALVRHVAQHPELINLLSANGPALNAQARSLKAALRLPGVRVIETRDAAVRR